MKETQLAGLFAVVHSPVSAAVFVHTLRLMPFPASSPGCVFTTMHSVAALAVAELYMSVGMTSAGIIFGSGMSALRDDNNH